MEGLPHSRQVIIRAPILAGAVFNATQVPVTLRPTNLNVGGEMHTGINCIRAQQSRRGITYGCWWSKSGRSIKILRKTSAIVKTRILRHFQMPKNTLKYKEEPFCTFLSISFWLGTFLSRPASDYPPFYFKKRCGERHARQGESWPEDLLVHGIQLLPQWYATNWSLWNHIFRESIHASGFDLGEIEESIDQVQKMLGAHENLFDYRE